MKTAETIHALELFLNARRPPENLRHEIDLGYKTENHSIIIFEVRLHWEKKDEKIESPIAKATWVINK